jgi:hypothetical protein
VSASHDDGGRAGPEEIDPPANHWDLVYGGRGATGVSWYQPHPTMSIRMIEALGASLVVATEREEHRTPAGVIQPFTWVALRL